MFHKETKMIKIAKKIRDGNERDARLGLLEDLFNDMNRSRFTVYKMNFFRGVFFGFGSVLGGTVLIGLLVWILSMTGAVVPGLANFVQDVTDTIQQK
ncbi:MAG: DUF5665 domain-containing protein [Candidatus Saccharimonas sp.]